MNPVSHPASGDLVPSAPNGDGRQSVGFQNAFHEGFYEGVDAGRPRPLREYLFILWKQRWLCLTAFALVLGGTVVTTLLAPRQFVAATRIKIASQEPIQLKLAESVLTDEQTDRILNGASVFTATQVAILESRDLAERVIRSHRLTDNAVFLQPGKAGRSGLFELAGELAGLFRPRGWMRSHVEEAAWQEDENPIEVPRELINRYMNYLTVSEVRGTDLIEVQFTTPNPQLSAVLAGAHVQAYKQAAAEARLVTDVTASDFLQRHVGEAQAKLEAAEAALNRFATEHPNVTLNREEKIVAQRMAELSSLATKAQAERVALETRHEFLTAADGVPVFYLLEQPAIQKLRFALLEVEAERATLGNRLGGKHPHMGDLAAQKMDLEQRLAAEVQKEVLSVESQLRAARLNEDALKSRLGSQEHTAVELRNLETAYNMFFGEVESSRALYESLLKRQKETLVNAELTTNNIQVVERAEVPMRPARPNVVLNLMLGAFAGLLVAVGATLLFEHFDTSVKNSDEIETLLQLPTLATVPNFQLSERLSARRRLVGGGRSPLSSGKRNGDGNNPLTPDLVVYHHPASVASEAFRVMRTGILHSAPDGPPKVILVTSSRAREGKTVTTLNLAAALALSGSTVLVIDADLRRPACHWALGAEGLTGLSSYLTGQTEFQELVRPVEGIPNVSLVFAGPMPPNPAELLDSGRMRAALAWAREHYDFVLLDSAPALPVTDSVVLAREVDGVLFVVKGQDTPRELVRRGRDQLLGGGARFVGVVINNVDSGSSDYYMYSFSSYSERGDVRVSRASAGDEAAT